MKQQRFTKYLATFAALALIAAAPVARAAAMSNYLENKVVDWMFRGQAFTPPSTIYVALATSACSDSAAGTEVTGGSYARVAVVGSLTNWAGTQSAGSTTASSGTGGTTSNNAAIVFPTPSASWGVVTHVEFFDAPTGGNLLFCKSLTASKTINNGDPAPQFGTGALTIQIDN